VTVYRPLGFVQVQHTVGTVEGINSSGANLSPAGTGLARPREEARMAEAVRLAMIGCGGMAGAHREGYQTLWEAGLRDFRITATCDVEAARAEEMAEQVAAFQGERPKIFHDPDDLLADGAGFDAVDIVTVHRAHHTLAIPCLEAGKAVCIEKPLAITMRAGRRMLEAAERTGQLLAVAENYRREPSQRAIRWAVQSGRIGEPRMLFWHDVGHRVWYWGWREHKLQAGGGWSLDGGVHFADLFRFFLGDVTRLVALSRAYFPMRFRDETSKSDSVQVDVEDTTMALLEFANGASGEWTSTNVARGQGFGRRVLYGSEGSLDLKDGLHVGDEKRTIQELTGEYMASLSPDEKERLFPRGITETVATELWEFVQAVQGKAQVETDALEGYKAEAISIALYESAAAGRWVTLEEVESLRVEVYQEDINADLGLS
jgi:predicted dehydrogenase